MKYTFGISVVPIVGLAFTWESQARQYPETGQPGIDYRREEVGEQIIECLLARNHEGQLLGILNYYPADCDPWEKAGNVNMWVHPQLHGNGIGTALFLEADRRRDIDLDQQRYSPSGMSLRDKLIRLYGTG